MFDTCEEQSGGQTMGRVLRNEAEKEARSLVSHNEDFLFYSKYMIATNEQKSKQTTGGVNGQTEKRKVHDS